MTYDESVRILLEGTCGINENLLAKATGLNRPAIRRFCAGGRLKDSDAMMAIGLFVFRRINAHVLISEVDRQPCEAADTIHATTQAAWGGASL